jgi:hypothetical protein
VDPREPVLIDREQPERVVGAQVVLAGQRQLGEVGHLVEVIRPQAGRVQHVPVERHVGIDVPHRRAQSHDLPRPQFLDAARHRTWLVVVFQPERTRHGGHPPCLLTELDY